MQRLCTLHLSIFPIPATEFATAKLPKNIKMAILLLEMAILLTDFITNNYTMEYLSLKPILNSVIFSLLGVLILILGYFIIEKITPENTWKEIVHNKNSALAIVFAALIIGISLIISAAIHG